MTVVIGRSSLTQPVPSELEPPLTDGGCGEVICLVKVYGNEWPASEPIKSISLIKSAQDAAQCLQEDF